MAIPSKIELGPTTAYSLSDPLISTAHLLPGPTDACAVVRIV
jgi:hypothetical protein